MSGTKFLIFNYFIIKRHKPMCLCGKIKKNESKRFTYRKPFYWIQNQI